MITSSSDEHSPPSASTRGGGGQPAIGARGISNPRAEFLDLFDRDYSRVVRFAMRLGADLQAADKAAEGAFTEAWKAVDKQPSVWASTPEPYKWIITLAYEIYMGRLAVRDELSVSSAPHKDNGSVAGHEKLTVGTLFVLDALRKLDPTLRAVLVFDMEDFSASEITVQLDIKDHQTTHRLLEKARKTLARELAGCRDQERRSL
jgi:DNA-directed RNA polymerase specialized sigma24 family protein